MQADPQIGAHYYQEYRPGEAEDEGEVIALGEIHSVPVGTFDDVLHTRDSTALEPDVVEHKFYAPGLGIILERELNQASGEVIAVLTSDRGRWTQLRSTCLGVSETYSRASLLM